MRKFKCAIVCCLLGGLLFSACNKEEIEARKTAYFFTKSTSSTSVLSTYVEGKLIGELPVVAEGIAACSEKSKGLEKLLNLGISTIVVKNNDDEVVIDVDLELKKKGREVNIKEIRKGTLSPHTYQLGGSQTCLIVELSEQ